MHRSRRLAAARQLPGEMTTRRQLARRTSPTNIGMSLLSTLAAHDLGYLPTDALVTRLDATLTHARRSRALSTGICSTGTTRQRGRRSIRATSRRSTAATWPAALITLARGCSSSNARRRRAPAARRAGRHRRPARRGRRRRHDGCDHRHTLTEINRLARAIVARPRGEAIDEPAIAAIGRSRAGQQLAASGQARPGSASRTPPATSLSGAPRCSTRRRRAPARDPPIPAARCTALAAA